MEQKEYSECPNCKEKNEGATIFKCRICRGLFCNFCDFGSQETKCPLGHGIVDQVGIIVKP